MRLSRKELFRGIGTSMIAAATVGWSNDAPVARAVSNSVVVPDTIFLDRNENPYGPSDRVLAVIRDGASSSHRYPRREYGLLVDKIAEFHRIKTEQIILGCGSTEILQSAAALWLGLGEKLFIASPSVSVIRDFALRNRAEIVEIPVNKRYQHDLDLTLTRVGNSKGVVYISNPNGVTGTLTPRKSIEEFVRKLPARVTVVIDEAFHHYVVPNGEYVSFLEKPLNDPRVIVVRTFSRAYGLAGMRIGYGVASPTVVRQLREQTVPLGVTSTSAKAAAAALEDEEYLQLVTRRNADARQEFLNRVNGFMLRTLDSHTNFVTVNPMRPPEQVVAHLNANGILIGPLIPAMPNYIQVSLGRASDMDRFWAAWSLLPPTDKMAM
jgi:histidinol-phosphate aminotransferase